MPNIVKGFRFIFRVIYGINFHVRKMDQTGKFRQSRTDCRAASTTYRLYVVDFRAWGVMHQLGIPLRQAVV